MRGRQQALESSHKSQYRMAEGVPLEIGEISVAAASAAATRNRNTAALPRRGSKKSGWRKWRGWRGENSYGGGWRGNEKVKNIH